MNDSEDKTKSTYQNIEDVQHADGWWRGFKVTTRSQLKQHKNQFSMTSKTCSSKTGIVKND